jgi:hypothetical protein
MADSKSKLPDLEELGNIAKTLFKGVRGSIEKIVQDYKKKRESHDSEPPFAEHHKPGPKPRVKTAAKANGKTGARTKKSPKSAAAKSKGSGVKHS